MVWKPAVAGYGANRSSLREHTECVTHNDQQSADAKLRVSLSVSILWRQGAPDNSTVAVYRGVVVRRPSTRPMR